MPVRLDLWLVDADGTPVPGASVRTSDHESPIRVVTDDAGFARLELPEKPGHFAIRVRCRGFVPKLVVWDLKNRRDPWPENYTLQMERAHTIGGLVRNQRGEPVANARVLVSLRGTGPGGGPPRIDNDMWEWIARTDAAGGWEFPHAPARFERISVRLAHPDYISHHYQTSVPPVEDFQRGKALLTLATGVPCEGTVTDECGQPLAGVRVVLGEGGNGSDTKDSRRTNAQGQFRFGGISFDNYGQPQVLSFRKEGFAPELVTLQPSSSVVRTTAVLRPGKTLRLRFTDAQGAPVPHVFLGLHGWRGHRPFSCCFRADESGISVWENAPPDAAQFSIMASGFQREELSLTATDDEQVIVLKRPLSISGRVIDAHTKQPVPKFDLIRGGEYPSQRQRSTFWNYHWTYPFENGEYRISVGDPVISRLHDGTVHEQGFRRIRISAPGYAPATSHAVANDETEDITCDFELEPADQVEGSVTDAQGRPVAGATLAFAHGSNAVFVSDGSVHERGGLVVATDANGRYTLPPQEQDYGVIVTHAQGGYRVTSCSELKSEPGIVLQPWGRVELLTTSVPGERPKYNVQEHFMPDARPKVRFVSSGVMASDGTVVFEHLPAGSLVLFTERRSMRDQDTITVESGQTTRIDRRTGRRAIIGRIALPPEGIAVEEPLARLSLRRRWPPGIKPDRNDFSEASFRIDITGKFRIDDVTPGLYQLTAIFFRSMPERDKQPDVAGLAHKEFELTPGDAPFDLGIIPFRPPDGLKISTHTCRPGGPG